MTTKYPPEADTIITDPATGYPMMEPLDIDHAPSCRGWCNRSSQPCKTPHVCGKRGTMHAMPAPDSVWPMRRAIAFLSHPGDDELRAVPLNQPHDLRMEIDRRVLRDICGVLMLPVVAAGAVAACYIIAECLAAGWLP